MGKFIEVWLINAVSLWIIDHFSAAVAFSDVTAIIFTALALTILNATIKPVLKVISFPLTILSFGLFSIIINALVLWAAFALSEGSAITSFGSAVWISIVLGILNGILDKLFSKD
ncbi:MAG: phage holin family protein [Solobacterium sp.]|nr:phage holin family protein [Solobacterium sp.]